MTCHVFSMYIYRLQLHFFDFAIFYRLVWEIRADRFLLVCHGAPLHPVCETDRNFLLVARPSPPSFSAWLGSWSWHVISPTVSSRTVSAYVGVQIGAASRQPLRSVTFYRKFPDFLRSRPANFHDFLPKRPIYLVRLDHDASLNDRCYCRIKCLVLFRRCKRRFSNVFVVMIIENWCVWSFSGTTMVSSDSSLGFMEFLLNVSCGPPTC